MMSKDLTEAIGVAVGRAARDAIGSTTAKARKGSNKHFSGATGLAAGAGLATLVPLAGRGALKLVKGGGSGGDGAGPIERLGDKVTNKVTGTAKDAINSKVDEVGGVGGVAKEAAKSMLPFGGGGKGGSKSQGVPGVGKGRRMPIQQAADIPVPVQTAYNQFTQFEEWPKFMHRLTGASQEDETHVTFKAKIWGKSKEFKAEIVEQRPDERIKWKVTEGMRHQGVVTFHQIADRLTRVEVSMDVEPGSLVEKAARGMRHIKRAVRADLMRFKAYTMMEEEETGEWRGEIEDGEVKSQQQSASSRRSSRSQSGGSRGRSSSGGRSSGGSSSSGRSSGGSSSSGRSSGGSSSSGRSSRAASSSGRSSRAASSSGRSSGGSSSSGRSSRSGSSNGRSGSSSSRSRSASNGRSSSSRQRSGSRS
jgi:uncharacterized membrane protein